MFRDPKNSFFSPNSKNFHKNSNNRFNYRFNYDNQRTPYTILLIFVLVIAFILQTIGVIDSQLVVLDTQKIVEFDIITAFTSLFFHAGIYHLLFNIVALYFFSKYVERELGVGTIFLFIIGGMIANITVSIYAGIINDHYLSIGASSGIATLIFFTIIAKPLTWLTPFAWFSIIIDILNFSNYESQTNHAVHVTGYISALILMSLFNFKNKKYIYYSILFNLAGLIALYIGFFIYGDSIISYIQNIF